MTGYLDVVPEVGRWSEYAETLIEKPFHKEEILEAVNRALSARRHADRDIVAHGDVTIDRSVDDP